MPSFKASLPELAPVDRAAWRTWLAQNHAVSTGIWLVLFKKGHRQTHTLTTDEAIDEALCFGWIDSVPNTVDAARYRLMMTPRRPDSVWSAVNKRRLVALEAAGLIAAPGQAAIDRAKANGSWTTLDASDSLVAPADLVTALAADLEAQRRFNAFSASSRRNILYWITAAKRPDTRARRVAETVRLAALGKRANYPADLKDDRP